MCVEEMGGSLPLLALSLKGKKIKLLRSVEHADEKNDEMMRRLWQLQWFVQYRQKLDYYRKYGGLCPEFPRYAVNNVEKKVDAWLAAKYPGYKR